MTKTVKVMNEEIKTNYLSLISDYLENENGEEVLRVGSNEIAMPIVDEAGNEKWMVLIFKIPTGSRDGDAYDGYSMAEDYKMKCEKKEAAKQKAKEKAKKDKAKREAKKAEKEGE